MTPFAFNSFSKAVESPVDAALQASDLQRALIRQAQVGDVAQLTEVLASSFYDRTGWMAWFYPLVKLGIQEDLKQRLKNDKAHYACLAALATSGEDSSTAINVIAPYPALAPSPVVETDCSDKPQATPQSTPQSVAGTVEVSQRHGWPWQGLEPQYAYISNLAVAPAFRRRGLAAQLLAACESLALTWRLEHLYLHVMEDNLEARRLYRRAGFELFQAEESTAVWLGLQSRRLLLHKRLPAAASPSR